jgi:hypothetical protein
VQARAHLKRSVSLVKRTAPRDLPRARLAGAHALAQSEPSDVPRTRELAEKAIADLRALAITQPLLTPEIAAAQRRLAHLGGHR